MTEDAIQLIAQLIKRLTLAERARLVQLIQQDDEGTAGVIAKLPIRHQAVKTASN